METSTEIANTTTTIPSSTPDVRVVLSHPGAITIYILLSFFSLFLLVCVFGLLLFVSQRVHRVTVKRKRSKRLVEATRKALKKLVLRTLSATDKEVASGSEQCAVCIEIYRAFDVVRILPCRHMFHKKCIDPWLLERRSCPLCKLDILISCGVAMDISSAMSSDYSSSGSSLSEVQLRLSHRPTWIGRLMVALLGYSRVSHGNDQAYQSIRLRGRFPNIHNRRMYLQGTTVDRGFCEDKQPPNFHASFHHGDLGFFSDCFRCCCCCLVKGVQRSSHVHHLGSLAAGRPVLLRDRLCEYHASILGVTAMPPTVQLAYYECYSSHANAVDERHAHSSPSGLSFDSFQCAPGPHRHFISWQLLTKIKQFVKEKCVLLQHTSTEMRETTPCPSLSSSLAKRHFAKSSLPRTTAKLHREKVLVHTVRDEDSSPGEPSLQTLEHGAAATSRSVSRTHPLTDVFEMPKVSFGECKSVEVDAKPDSDEISECSLVVLPPPPHATNSCPFVDASLQLPSGTDSSPAGISHRSFLIGCADNPFGVNRSQNPHNDMGNSINGKLGLTENIHPTDTQHLGYNTQCYESIYQYGLPEHAPPPPYHLVVTHRDVSDDYRQSSASTSPYPAEASYSPYCPMCRAARVKRAEVDCETRAPPAVGPCNNRRSKWLFRSPSLPPHAQSLEVFTQFHGAPVSPDSASTDETEHVGGRVAHSLMHGVRVIVEPPEVQYHGGSPALESNIGSADDCQSVAYKPCAKSEPATLMRPATGDRYANLSATV